MHKRVFIRADGNSNMGLGHVYRSIALAEHLAEDFSCRLIIRAPDKALLKTIKTVFESVVVIPEEYDTAAELYEISSLLTKDDIIVLDGYAFNTTYQQKLKTTNASIVCVDDIYAYRFVADVVINHALGIPIENYELAPYTKLFLGPSYALIRKRFLEQALKGKKAGTPGSIFVCLGGADPTNTTLKVLQHIHSILPTDAVRDIHVVLGSSYKYRDTLLPYVLDNPVPIKLYQGLGVPELLNIMTECSVAICSPSTITFEYTAVSDGVLFLCKTADNQADFYNFLINSNSAKDFFLDFLPDNIRAKAPKDRLLSQLLDGQQNQRILSIFHEL